MSELALTNELNPRGILRFRLEHSFDDFIPERFAFVEQLAKIVDVSPDQVWITELVRGCVLITLNVPANAVAEFERLWNSQEANAGLVDFKKKYDVRWVRHDTMVERTAMFLRRIPTPAGRTLTWLHLSDLHQRAGDGAKPWAQQQVSEALIEALPELLSEHDLRPDMIFFTGDMAFSGRPEEYEAAETVMAKVRSALPKPAGLYLVPGNHDVTWDQIEPDVEKKLRKKLDSRDIVNAYLIDPQHDEDRKFFGKRLQHFTEFSERLRPDNPIARGFGHFHEIIHEGITLGIGEMNSAWRSTRKDLIKNAKNDLDLGHLVLGEPCLTATLKAGAGSDLIIGLIHHPPMTHWYAEFDMHLQEAKLQGFDFILSGHEHWERSFTVSPLADKRSTVYTAAGALYFHDEYPNSINAVRLDLDQGTGTIYYWNYLPKYYAWRKNVGPAKDGYIEFPLNEHLARRLRK